MTDGEIAPEHGWDSSFPRLAKVTGRMLAGVLALNGAVMAERISNDNLSFEPQESIIELEVSPVIAEIVTTTTTPPTPRSTAKPPSTGILPTEVTQPECTKSSIPWLPETVARWHPYVSETAKVFYIPAEMLEILIVFETLGNPEAVSHQGAEGVAQILPSTAIGLAKQLNLPPLNLKDPASNIYLSGKYIRNVLDSGVVDLSNGFNAEAAKRTAIAYHGGRRNLDLYLYAGFDVLRQHSPKTARYGERVAQAWDERSKPQSVAFNDLMTYQGPKEALAAAARIGTPPC